MSTDTNKKEDKDYNQYIKNLIRFSIKKGKKEITEKNFRESLYYYSTLNNKQNIKHLIEDAFNKSDVCFNVRSKRLGSKNINIPFYIHESKQIFTSYTLLLKNADKKNQKKKKFSERFISSVLDTANNNSFSTKKKAEIYKLVESSLNDSPKIK